MKTSHESSVNIPEADHVRQTLNDVAAQGKRALEDGLDAARAVVEEQAEVLREKAEALRQRVEELDLEQYPTKVRQYVKKNPWRSVAIGVGIGLVIGLLISADKE